MRFSKVSVLASLLAGSTLVVSQDSASLSGQLDTATFQQILDYVSANGDMTVVKNIFDQIMDAVSDYQQAGGCGSSTTGSTGGSTSGSGTGADANAAASAANAFGNFVSTAAGEFSF